MDLNADVAESYLGDKVGCDEKIIPMLSSASFACGFHGGDPLTIFQALQIARQNHIVVGAHPSYNDRLGFGRHHIATTKEQLTADIQFQLGGLIALAKPNYVRVRYVKAHGALYNDMYSDEDIASTFARAVAQFDPELAILGQPGSALQSIANKLGIQYFREGFADRRYSQDGNLVPRSQADSMIADPVEQLRQALSLATSSTVESITGHQISVKVDSICIHGDGPNAVTAVTAISHEFKTRGIAVRSFC